MSLTDRRGSEPSAMPVPIAPMVQNESVRVSPVMAPSSGAPSLHASLPAGFLHQSSPSQTAPQSILADVDVPSRVGVSELADVDLPGLRKSFVSDVDVRRSYGSLPPNVTESTLRDSMLSQPPSLGGSQPPPTLVANQSPPSMPTPLQLSRDPEISPRPLAMFRSTSDVAPVVMEQALRASGPDSGLAPIVLGHPVPSTRETYSHMEMPLSSDLAPPPIRLPGVGVTMPASLYTTESMSYISRSGKEVGGSFTVMPSGINDRSQDQGALQTRILQEENSMLRQNLHIEQQANKEFADRKELEIENLTRKMRKMDERVAGDDLETSKLSLELEQTTLKLRTCEETVQNHKALVKNLEEQLEMADSRGRRADVAVIEKELKLNKEIEALKIELAKGNAEVKTQNEQQNQVLQSRLKEERENARHMMTDIRALKDKVETLERERTLLREDLAASKVTEAQLRANVQELNTANNHKNEISDEVAQLKMDYNEKLEMALVTMSDLQQQHADMQQTIHALTEENSELKRRVITMQTQPSAPQLAETPQPLFQPRVESVGLQSIGLEEPAPTSAAPPAPLSTDSDSLIPKVLTAKAPPEFVSPRYSGGPNLVMQQLGVSASTGSAAPAGDRGIIMQTSRAPEVPINQTARIASQRGPDPAEVSDALNEEISMGREDDVAYGGQSLKPRQGISLKNFQSFPLPMKPQSGADGSSNPFPPPLQHQGSYVLDEGAEAPFSSAQSFATFERSADEMRMAGYDPDSVIGV